MSLHGGTTKVGQQKTPGCWWLRFSAWNLSSEIIRRKITDGRKCLVFGDGVGASFRCGLRVEPCRGSFTCVELLRTSVWTRSEWLPKVWNNTGGRKSLVVGDYVEPCRGFFTCVKLLRTTYVNQVRMNGYEPITWTHERYRPCHENRLRAHCALAWAVSSLSCGTVQQGVSSRGSAGTKTYGPGTNLAIKFKNEKTRVFNFDTKTAAKTTKTA